MEILKMIPIQKEERVLVLCFLALVKIESPSAASPFSFKDSDADKDIAKYKRLIESDRIDMKALRSLAWRGIPSKYRAVTWKLLLVYLHAQLDVVGLSSFNSQPTKCDYFKKAT